MGQDISFDLWGIIIVALFIQTIILKIHLSVPLNFTYKNIGIKYILAYQMLDFLDGYAPHI